jgi:hypothetical protein
VREPTQFTPGPWRLTEYSFGQPGGLEVAIHAGSSRLAVVHGSHVVPDVPGAISVLPLPAAANARLIAAAPALYEQLHAAVLALRSYQYGNSAEDLAREAADAGEALLALVRGEEVARA